MLRLMRPLNRLLKKLPDEVALLRQAHPHATVELWSSDEHRIGLKPILRRVWGKKGSKVTAVVKQRYQWMYVYGFVEPASGRTSWLLMPTVNVEAFELVLSAFAQEHHLGPDKHIALVRGSRRLAYQFPPDASRRAASALLAFPFAGIAASGALMAALQ